MKQNKRGIAPIIATVLLIVIVLASIALIIGFVVPFMQERMGTAELCYKAQGIQIDSQATCYEDENLILKIVWSGNEQLDLTKIRLSVSTATETKSIEIPGDVDGELPQHPGEARTYTLGYGGGSLGFEDNFKTTPLTAVSIAPVIKPEKGNEITCDIKEIAIEHC